MWTTASRHVPGTHTSYNARGPAPRPHLSGAGQGPLGLGTLAASQLRPLIRNGSRALAQVVGRTTETDSTRPARGARRPAYGGRSGEVLLPVQGRAVGRARALPGCSHFVRKLNKCGANVERRSVERNGDVGRGDRRASRHGRRTVLANRPNRCVHITKRTEFGTGAGFPDGPVGFVPGEAQNGFVEHRSACRSGSGRFDSRLGRGAEAPGRVPAADAFSWPTRTERLSQGVDRAVAAVSPSTARRRTRPPRSRGRISRRDWRGPFCCPAQDAPAPLRPTNSLDGADHSVAVRGMRPLAA